MRFDVFSRILARWDSTPPTQPSIPDGLRIYAVGDIHGRADLLEQLHQEIKADARRECRESGTCVIYLGDYIDRGLDSANVIELLLHDPVPGADSVFLKGNHEDLLMLFLEDPSFGPAWFDLGGDGTLLSYGVEVPRHLPLDLRFQEIRERLLASIPQEHLEFLESLIPSYQAGDYLFAHAGIKPGVPLEHQDERDLLWIRDEFLTWRKGFPKIVVHGHSLTHRPDVQKYRIGIDTGAYATNVLTCLVLEGSKRRFISTPSHAGR